MSNNSVLSVKPTGQSTFLDVPIIRGKSAYQSAIEGGLPAGIDENLFNNKLGNIVTGIGGNGNLYQIVFSSSKPSSNTDSNVITIVLE